MPPPPDQTPWETAARVILTFSIDLFQHLRSSPTSTRPIYTKSESRDDVFLVKGVSPLIPTPLSHSSRPSTRSPSSQAMEVLGCKRLSRRTSHSSGNRPLFLKDQTGWRTVKVRMYTHPSKIQLRIMRGVFSSTRIIEFRGVGVSRLFLTFERLIERGGNPDIHLSTSTISV